MSNEDLVSAITHEPGLELLYHSSSGFIIRGRNTAGFRCQFAVPRDAVEDASWRDLRGVLLGEREPLVMGHYTRITGYFSNMRSWNRSKIRENRDRHKGVYAVN